MSDRLTYEDYCVVADRLFYEEMEMPTANKTYKVLQYGSLATHQLYLRRWREERKRKPSTLPEQIETLLVQKTKQLADSVWDALNKGSNEIITNIKHESEHALKTVTEEKRNAHIERESAISELALLKEQHEAAQQKIKELEHQLKEEQKLLFAAEQSRGALLIQINEIKQSAKQQIGEAKQQYSENIQLLKEQHQKTELKMKHDIEVINNSWQGDKNSYKNQIKEMEDALDRVKHNKELADKENIGLTAKLEEMQARVIEAKSLIERLNADKLNCQEKMQLFEIENIRATTELVEAKEQLNNSKQQISKLQKQLLDYSIKIGSLEEKNKQYKNKYKAQIDVK